MSLLRVVDVYTPFAPGDGEYPLYIASDRAKIESIVFMVGKTRLRGNPNFTTISIINKGTDGLGNTVIFSINSNSLDPSSIDFIEFVPTIAINRDDPSAHIPLQKGSVLTLKKEDNAGNIDLGASSIIINERRF